MSILVNKQTRVLTQGITGATGQFHTKACKEYGTQMVAGVTPGKGGAAFEGIPIFDTVARAVHETGANATVIYVPPPMRLWKRSTPASGWWCALRMAFPSAICWWCVAIWSGNR